MARGSASSADPVRQHKHMTTRQPFQDHAQLDLFGAVLKAYAGPGSMSNADLYEKVAAEVGIPMSEVERKTRIGHTGEMHSTVKRRLRWQQQTLKALGLLERDENARGTWRLTSKGREKLTPATGRVVLLGFSTDLGLALWAASSSVFPSIDEPINLCLTSPPYPLAKQRAYGGPSAAEYVDWLTGQLEPIVKLLVPGGSICLNVSNDIFEPGLPSRSLYRERLVIALCDRLGLHKMDELIWHAPNKVPGPLQWASLSRQQLNTAWEPVYWFTNDPRMCKSDNRRVLQEHTERHLKLIERGGEDRTAEYGDGAYRLKPGAYGSQTLGRIPRNVITCSTNSGNKRVMRSAALAQGLPTHGALMPLPLARFLVEFLTEPGDLTVDPFFGWGTTGKACEELGRRWMGTELMGEHVLGAANGFRGAKGFEMAGQGW